MNTRLAYLYQRYIDEICTTEEREEFFLLIGAEQHTPQVNDLLDHTWNEIDPGRGLSEEKVNHILDHILTNHKKPVVRKISWYRYAAAALAFITVSAGLYLYTINSRPDFKKQNGSAYVNSIPAATNKATLTLANGSTINLDKASNGEIAEQSGATVIKAGDGKLVYEISKASIAASGFNTITTPRGGLYQVDLPDGTKVWLNAASSLKYPTVFNGQERKVELSGEAYFEVAKKKIPFLVKTAQQQVAVLGTHFNINAYTDEAKTKTTLFEGAVRVSLSGQQASKSVNEQILAPGQQSVVGNNRLNVSAVDLDEALAWKNGYFQFNEENLVNIMKQLSRWYDIDVVFEGRPSQELFLLKVPRKLGLSEVLKILATNGINFKIEGRTLIVKS
jgi:transmembrane sensor